MKSFDIARAKPAREPREQIRSAAPVMTQKPLRPKRTWLRVAGGVVVVVLIILAILAFYVLPKARVEVVARTEPVTRDFEIRVDKSLEQQKTAELAIPGKILEEEVSDSKAADATGKKNVGKKASGFLYIYNFTKTTLILKANTTVLQSGGRQYYFTQDVSGIRPTAMIGLKDQEVDPTSLIAPVPVVASQPGTEYNLLKGARLEIQNEVLGSHPDTLYAIVAEDISGGTTKEVKVVTEADISNAHQNLSKALIEKAKQNMAGKYGVTALDNAMAAEVLEPKSSVQPGTEIPTFEVSQKVRVKALTFDETLVKAIALERIRRLLPENKILEEGKGTRFSAQFASVSLDQGIGVLVTHFEGTIIYKVEKDELVGRLRGKTVDEIKEVLLSRPEIESAKVKFYPFWVKRAPKFGNKIVLEVVTE